MRATSAAFRCDRPWARHASTKSWAINEGWESPRGPSRATILSASRAGATRATCLMPFLTVLPMGRSGAMHFWQTVAMRAIAVAGFPDPQIVNVGRVSVALPTSTATAAAGCAGNFYILGHDPPLATQRRDDTPAVRGVWGLTVHEETGASTDAVLVGLELRRGRGLSVKRRNPRRLRAALDTVLRRGCYPSKMLEVLVGHITWACLSRRDLLRVLSAVHPYLAAGLPTTSRMWGSVRVELGLVVLAGPWHDIVWVSDASELGVGVAARPVQPTSLPAGLRGLDIAGLESFIRVYSREFLEVPREFFDGAGRQRRAAAARQVAAARGSSGCLSVLGRTAVRAVSDRFYQVYLLAFLQFCLVMTTDWASEADMDLSLTTHLYSTYSEGRAPNEGSGPRAALAHCTPTLFQGAARALPRAIRCRAGGRRRAPTRMRWPLPRGAACALAGARAARGQPRICLFVRALFVAYLRPQGALWLAGRHLAPPLAHSGQAPTPRGRLLHDSDLQLPEKTNLRGEDGSIGKAK
ncbi:unnamed protein product [Prorocentrum cordatum]|uniref:Uncharacterized protein n=1 Tax=Prorocentrum cordatum TaxID=2364126 RepID=A0ABN9SZA4_9DINO|nr:unnamed protein product [Polarella glacialis]